MTAAAGLVQFDVLNVDQTAQLNGMLGVIQKKRKPNEIRSRYHRGKQIVQHLGIAVSPELERLRTAVGWAGTVVARKNERRVVDHLVVADDPEMTKLVNEIWVRNEMDLESGMLHQDKSIHGLTFNVVASSDDGPVILPTPASRMTCEYLRKQRRVTMAASDDGIVERGGLPQATLYYPDATYVVARSGRGWKILNRFENPTGMVPVVRYVNRPLLDRPWGDSDITPSVMSYTDAAVRTLLGTEVAREFFAVPKMVALNLSESAFQDERGRPRTQWESYIGRVMAVEGALDEDGQPSPLEPKVFQLPASDPTAFVTVMKMLSQLMAAETGYPPSMWGFVTENPPSGDAQAFFEATLVRNAKYDNKVDAVWHNNSMRLALLAAGVRRDQLPNVEFVWANPATPQLATTTDAIMKQGAAKQIPERSTVALETLGYERGQVERIQAEWKKQDGLDLIRNLAAAGGNARQDPQAAALAAADRPPVGAAAAPGE